MALNRQNQQNIQDTATYVEDTLRSVAANIGEALKEAVDAAFDSKDATVLSSVGKDFTRSMIAAARASEDLVKNQSKISQGLLTSKDIEKQMQAIGEKRLELSRRMQYITDLAAAGSRSITAQEQDAFNQAKAALDVQESLLNADRNHLDNVEKTIGLTGKLVSSLGQIPGVGRFIDAKKIEQEMRIVANETQSKFKTMGVAAKMIGRQLLDGLLDPLTLITAIWNGFMKVDEAATEFTRITGQSTSAISSMNSELASTVDILEVASNLSKEIGIAGNNFISPQQLAAVAETRNLLGLSAEQATQLAIQTKLSGQNVDTFKKNVMAGVKQSNLQNRSGVEYGVIIKDILNTSEDITMSLGNNPEKLAKAATAARAFGLTLEDVDKIAESMLNFEDSISNELEAQLLTGKQMNLAKAREYALTNDLEGLSKELSKNGLTAAEYSNMNRLGQEKYAAALGISREQLAKSILAQKASADLTEEQRRKVLGMNEADYERMAVQERIQKSLDKIAQAFAPILEKFVVPLVEVLTKIMNLPLVPYILLAVVTVRSLGLSVMGVGKAFMSMFSLGKQALLGLVGLFKKGGLTNLVGGLADRLRGGASQGSAALGQQGGAGGGIAQSLSKVNTTALLKGAAAMALASVGIFIFAKAVQELEKVEAWDRVAIGLGLFAGSMYLLSAASKSLANPQVMLGLGILTLAVLGIGVGIGIAATGMAKFVDSISNLSMDTIAPMLLLGPALFSIAAGLMAVGAAGLVALPGLAALAVVSKIAPSIVSTSEKTAGAARGTAEENSMAVLEAKFDTLIELVKQGSTINLDGAKIATTVGRNLPRVQTATS